MGYRKLVAALPKIVVEEDFAKEIATEVIVTFAKNLDIMPQPAGISIASVVVNGDTLIETVINRLVLESVVWGPNPAAQGYLKKQS